MSIKRGELSPLLNSGCKNTGLNDLVGRSGVGSVCTGCHPLLSELVGNSIWTSVKITRIQKVSDDAKAYCFESNGEPLYPAKAGQHIIVQAYIDGEWELRRYTLTTPAEETSYREITVQREPSGKFSSWLHQISESENMIRISQPVGDVTPDLVSSKPLICLVGGIGVTPAVSIIRSIANKEGNSRQLIIDYSVIHEGRLVYKNELQAVAEQKGNISVNFRLTNEQGFINQNDVVRLVKKYPDSEFYLCGPSLFTQAVTSFLGNAGVADDAISIELFSVPENNKVNQSKRYFYLGLALFIAFLAQDVLQLKMPWLENLQAIETYKIYSGLFVVLYIFSQFIMSYNKSCEAPHASATTYQQHKLRGALAPLIFFMHSTQFGVAYLLMLSVVYFGNFLLGLFNHERIKDPLKRIRYFKYWLPMHIALSVLSVALVGFHIYVVASY